MDEAEDVFSFDIIHSDAPSKLSLNRTLEKNKKPVIWVMNSVRYMDEAYLRRFQYCMKIEQPDSNQRIKIWKNLCKKHSVKMSDNQIASMVRKYDVSVGVINTAISNMKLTNDVRAIEKTIRNFEIAQKGHTSSASEFNESAFCPDILNTDVDLIRLGDRLETGGYKNFSLCLYGAPGTGKSMYARYLANRLGMPVIEKKASDLHDKYVGETEKRIAAAFAQAHREKALLIFDEVDSFLSSRENAQRSFELSAVNEMLTQMENASIPFVCTTNMMKHLDPAALRRFTFKVKYDYMTADMVRTAFKHFFDLEIPDGAVNKLTAIAPGDFSVVKKKADILGVRDAMELVEMLTTEMTAKGVTVREKIGFGMP